MSSRYLRVDIGRGLTLCVGSLFAWTLLAIGFLSPLTPSEGNPSWLRVFLFVGGPVILLVALALQTRRTWVWGVAIVQSVLILAVSIWLLLAIWR